MDTDKRVVVFYREPLEFSIFIGDNLRGTGYSIWFEGR